jgi:hypothetical protein
MQVSVIVFPNEDGLTVLVWGKWAQGSMRVRRFDGRETMISTLQDLKLISPDEAVILEDVTFENSCPLFFSEIEEETLAKNDFGTAY